MEGGAWVGVERVLNGVRGGVGQISIISKCFL